MSWNETMGLRIIKATPDEVSCEFDVEDKHLQEYGIVHGGVHAGVIETLASYGAALVALPRNQHVVGLENSTSFIRAVRAGTTLHAVARPVTRGKKSQVWEAWIRDADEHLVAQGRVRLICLDVDQPLG
jgi:uncharacterized protein (TIGR00369 family)